MTVKMAALKIQTRAQALVYVSEDEMTRLEEIYGGTQTKNCYMAHALTGDTLLVGPFKWLIVGYLLGKERFEGGVPEALRALADYLASEDPRQLAGHAQPRTKAQQRRGATMNRLLTRQSGSVAAEIFVWAWIAFLAFMVMIHS